jgi:hypothetical protein
MNFFTKIKFLFPLLFLSFAFNAFAQNKGSADNPTLGKINSNLLGVPTDINLVIAGLVQIAVAAAGLIFFAMLITGGLRYLSAGGDEKAASAARSTLTQAFIGLIIVMASFLISDLIFNIFKIKGVGFFNP